MACVRVPKEDMGVFVVLSHGQQFITGRIEGEGEDTTLMATIHSRQLTAISCIPYAYRSFPFARFGGALAGSDISSTWTDNQTHDIVVVSGKVLLRRSDFCKDVEEQDAHSTEIV